MFQKTVIVIVFAFAVGLVGCRACWGPYDRCQPTFVPEAGDQCMGELYRNGSVLGGMERRTNESGCSSCAGGVADGSEAAMPANYYESSEAVAESISYPETISPQAEPLPPQMNQPLPMDEFLPNSSNPTEQFPLSDDGTI